MEHILMVEDEPGVVKGLRLSLEQAGFRVSTAADGRTALQMIRDGHYDLILLDLMLPEVDGLTLCREIRKRGDTPIIMVTARSEDVDKILGLEMGADDYITKPFNTRELIARCRAVLRRARQGGTGPEGQVIRAGDLVIDPARRRAALAGRHLELTAREFDLLTLLARHPGVVYTRQQLLDLVWGYDFVGDERTVDVHIRRLREKVEPDPSHPRYIRTKWGVGYYLEAEP
ncbi:MAG TPA: response regulator transcription factor [Symbiobacteriaceae bacterium]